MSREASSCRYCDRPLVWLDCEYPFLYHVGAMPRHGEWVPGHGCVADASRVSADAFKGCGGA